MTGTPGTGKSLFGIYLLHRVLHGHYPHITSVVYLQTTRTKCLSWAFERLPDGSWAPMTGLSTVTVPSLFINDNSRAEAVLEIEEAVNVLITSPRVCFGGVVMAAPG